MNWHDWVLVILISQVALQCFLTYMAFRNNATLRFARNPYETDLEAFGRLPRFEIMVFKFWVWPLSRFLK